MINKNIIALGFVSFFTDMASSMVTTILPLYIVFILHEGVDKLGFVIAISTFISYSFRVLFGYLSDRFLIVKPFLVAGYLLSAITKPLLYFANSWQSIAILRGTERIGKAIRSPSKDALISHFSKKNRSGKSFGFHKMMDIAGEMFGSIIVFVALFFYGKNIELFQDIFAWTFIPGIIAVVIVIFFVQDISSTKSSQKPKIKFKDDYKLLPILLIYFGYLLFFFDQSFYIIKAKEAGIKMEYIPLLVIVLNLTQTLFSYLFGLKTDQYGAKNILLFSFILGVVSLFFLFINQIFLSFILLGLFLVASLNALRTYISDNAKNKATLYGFFYAGIALSSSLGAILISNIWHHFGFETAFFISLCAMIALSLLLMLLVKEER